MTAIKMGAMYIFSILFLVVAAGSFKLSDFDNHYQLDISTLPVGFPSTDEVRKIDINDEEKFQQLLDKIPDNSDPSYVFITSKSGQRFACKIPEVPEKKDDVIPDSLNPRYVADIVAAGFYVKDCIQKTTGWWSYELCRGKTITQFHGRKGKGEYAEYSLGMFTAKYLMPDYTQSTKDRMLYLEELYSGGSMCDVLGKQVPRKTSVRYECDPLLSTNEAYIQHVNEEASCEYLITVKLGSICKLPQFMPLSDREEPLLIGCQPLIEKEKAAIMVKKLKEKEERKKEGKRILKEQSVILDSIQRRRAAHRRCALSMNTKENKKIEDRLEIDYNQSTLWYMEAMHLAKEGSLPDEKQLDALKKIGKFADDLDLFMGDYDSTDDMDRGNFWFYMQDKRWPKDEFPRSTNYADLFNAYYEEAERLAVSTYPSGVAMEIRRKARLDPFKMENNVLVSRSDIGQQLDSYFPSWYARDGLSMSDYVTLVISSYYQNEVAEVYIETLYSEFGEGNEVAVSSEDVVHEIARNLAPLWATLRILTQHGSVRSNSLFNHLVILTEKLVSATEYAQISWEVRHPDHQLSFKGKFSEDEKKLAVSGYWNQYFNRQLANSPPEIQEEKRDNYKKILTELGEEVHHVAFEVVWSKKSEELVKKIRQKLEKRNSLMDVLGGRGGMAVPFALEDQQKMMDLLEQAGLGDVDVKIQLVNTEEILGADGENNAEMQEIVNEVLGNTMEVFAQRQKAEKRERAYWSKVDDEL